MSNEDFYRLKMEKAENKLRCPLCKTNDKDSVLPCGHTFCNGCMAQNIESRKRKCPLCRLAIGKGDVKKIHLAVDQSDELE
jgi:E3 ubiquitin-protein ligase BRE1